MAHQQPVGVPHVARVERLDAEDLRDDRHAARSAAGAALRRAADRARAALPRGAGRGAGRVSARGHDHPRGGGGRVRRPRPGAAGVEPDHRPGARPRGAGGQAGRDAVCAAPRGGGARVLCAVGPRAAGGLAPARAAHDHPELRGGHGAEPRRAGGAGDDAGGDVARRGHGHGGARGGRAHA